MRYPTRFALLAALCSVVQPTAAATPSETLMEAAFRARDKASAIALVEEADRGAAAALAADPRDRQAHLVRAMALGYRAKLKRHRGDAQAARARFEQLHAANPRDPEAAICVGTWHLDSIVDLGGFMARIALGADRATGLAMTDRAVALGDGRAMFAGLAALLRLSIDPADPRGRLLAEAAGSGKVEHPLDRVFRQAAAAILVPLRANDHDATRRLARQLLPFGRLTR